MISASKAMARLAAAARKTGISFKKLRMEMQNNKLTAASERLEFMLYQGEYVFDNATRLSMWRVRWHQLTGLTLSTGPHVYKRCLNCGSAMIVPLIEDGFLFCRTGCGQDYISNAYKNVIEQ